MPKSIPAAAEGVPNKTDDKVVSIALQLGAALRQEEEYSARSSLAKRAEDFTPETYYDSAMKHRHDETLVLADLLTLAPATSLAGAAVQIAEAVHRLHYILDDIPEGAETYQIKKNGRAVERLLYSAMMAVEGAADLTISEIVTPYFSDPQMNPWVEVRIAQAQKGGEE